MHFSWDSILSTFTAVHLRVVLAIQPVILKSAFALLVKINPICKDV